MAAGGGLFVPVAGAAIVGLAGDAAIVEPGQIILGLAVAGRGGLFVPVARPGPVRLAALAGEQTEAELGLHLAGLGGLFIVGTGPGPVLFHAPAVLVEQTELEQGLATAEGGGPFPQFPGAVELLGLQMMFAEFIEGHRVAGLGPGLPGQHRRGRRRFKLGSRSPPALEEIQEFFQHGDSSQEKRRSRSWQPAWPRAAPRCQ